MSQIYEKMKDLLDNLDYGSIGLCVYDAAWVARLKEPVSNKPIFPEVLAWLRRSQWGNGSWGGEVEYFPGRIISTLVALLALQEHEPDDDTESQIHRGLDYIKRTWPIKEYVPYITIGFEILMPTLLKQACTVGLPLEMFIPEAEEMAQAKLKYFPPDFVFSSKTPLSFSIEYKGDNLDSELAKSLQIMNGSIANSVSTTAYFYRLSGDEKALQYLQDVVAASGPENIPFTNITDQFQRLWVLYNLHIAGVMDDPYFATSIKSHLDYLRSVWNEDGIGWSSFTGMVDSDETSVGLLLLYDRGYDVEMTLLQPYEKETHFECYPQENTPSVSANVHILDCLNHHPYHNHTKAVSKIIQFLHKWRIKDTYWNDKWHISPYYTTGHAIIAIAPHDLEMAEKAVRWMEHAQREEGGWGAFGLATAEETAYCLQALITFKKYGGLVIDEVIHHAADFIYEHINDVNSNIPPLWIAKALYRPTQVVRSALLSALMMYEKEF